MKFVIKNSFTDKVIAEGEAEKFKDFQFGLKLLSQNTAQTEFTIDQAVIDAPEKALSDWVVKSYRPGGS